jgi:hypothetical protein
MFAEPYRGKLSPRKPLKVGASRASPFSPLPENEAAACAFDLLLLDGDDPRRLPLLERKTRLKKLLRRSGEGIQYVEQT